MNIEILAKIASKYLLQNVTGDVAADFTEATWQWIKPLFLEKNPEKEIVEISKDLEKQKEFEEDLIKLLRANPQLREEIESQILEKDRLKNKNIISNSTVSAGGNVIIGDTTHYGSGDNVAGNKLVIENTIDEIIKTGKK